MSVGSPHEEILPYLYEPEIQSSELENLDEEDDTESVLPVPEEPEHEGRLRSTDWCSCGHCMSLGTVRECLCCKEIDALINKLEQERHELNCITQNPEFHTVVLDQAVLRTALVANMDRLREPLDEPLSNSYVEVLGPSCKFYNPISFFSGYCVWLLTASLRAGYIFG